LQIGPKDAGHQNVGNCIGSSLGGNELTCLKGIRPGNKRRGQSCGQNGKRITSVAAIVAPQTCTLVRDASVLVTPARPATSRTLASLLRRLPARFFPVLLGFVLLQFREAFVCPIANLRTRNFLCNWLGHSSFFDPPVQGSAMNSKQPRGFRNRVSCHVQYATWCRIMSSKICGEISRPPRLRIHRQEYLNRAESRSPTSVVYSFLWKYSATSGHGLP
jgi:hypothetical protein